MKAKLSGIHSVKVRQCASGSERGSIYPPLYPHARANPLFPLTSYKNRPPRLSTPFTPSPIISPIALAGDLVRTGYQGGASVPGWSSSVGGWVMNP